MRLYFTFFLAIFLFSFFLLEYFVTNIVQGILATFIETFITFILVLLLQIGVIGKDYLGVPNSSPSVLCKLIYMALPEGVERF